MSIKNFTIQDAGDLRKQSDKYGLNPYHHSISQLRDLLEKEMEKVRGRIMFIDAFINELNITSSHFIKPFLELACQKMSQEEIGNDISSDGCE